MSFILDALRKSEAERQHQNAPGIASIPQGGSARSGPRWMWLAVGLLVVNLAVLAGVLLKMNDGDAPPATDAVPTEAANAQQVPAVADAPPVTRAPATAADATETASDDTAAVTGARTALSQDTELTAGNVEVAASSAPGSSTASATTTNRFSNVPPATSTEAASQVVSSFNELRASGVLNLPDLHLDIHVYSGQPDERFVFVNMAKYREKATLSEGPVVQEITPEGVILDYRGTDFLLPRE